MAQSYYKQLFVLQRRTLMLQIDLYHGQKEVYKWHPAYLWDESRLMPAKSSSKEPSAVNVSKVLAWVSQVSLAVPDENSRNYNHKSSCQHCCRPYSSCPQMFQKVEFPSSLGGEVSFLESWSSRYDTCIACEARSKHMFVFDLKYIHIYEALVYDSTVKIRKVMAEVFRTQEDITSSNKSKGRSRSASISFSN